MVIFIIVGFVAGGLLVEIVIFMVMGVNIGIIVINIFVSFGYMCCKEEFCCVFVSVIIYDFFNFFVVLIFLFLEMMFGILEKVLYWFVLFLFVIGDMSMKGFDFIKLIIKFVIIGFEI